MNEESRRAEAEKTSQAPETEDRSAAAQAAETGRPEERDFAGEVAELIREFPQAGKDGALPEEVVQAAVREGKTLLEAYRDYALAREGEAQPAERKETGTGRAPVRGVSGGWPVTGQASDPFMEGFAKDE